MDCNHMYINYYISIDKTGTASMLNVELHIVTSFDAASSNSYDIVRKIKAYTDDEEMQETPWLICQGRMQDFSGGGGPNFKIFGILYIHAAKRHVASSEAASLC